MRKLAMSASKVCCLKLKDFESISESLILMVPFPCIPEGVSPSPPENRDWLLYIAISPFSVVTESESWYGSQYSLTESATTDGYSTAAICSAATKLFATANIESGKNRKSGETEVEFR